LGISTQDEDGFAGDREAVELAEALGGLGLT
jgi:hypothetical protein